MKQVFLREVKMKSLKQQLFIYLLSLFILSCSSGLESTKMNYTITGEQSEKRGYQELIEFHLHYKDP